MTERLLLTMLSFSCSSPWSGGWSLDCQGSWKTGGPNSRLTWSPCSTMQVKGSDDVERGLVSRSSSVDPFPTTGVPSGGSRPTPYLGISESTSTSYTMRFETARGPPRTQLFASPPLRPPASGPVTRPDGRCPLLAARPRELVSVCNSVWMGFTTAPRPAEPDPRQTSGRSQRSGGRSGYRQWMSPVG